MVYQPISLERHNDIDVAWMTLQISCWAMTYLGARGVGDAVRQALQREKRVMSGIEVIQIIVENETEDYYSECDWYRLIQDYKIIYREA